VGEHTPRLDIVVLQAELAEAELIGDSGVTHHDVNTRPAIDAYAWPSLDRRYGAADDRVALDHLDVQSGAGEVAGGDQAVVAGTDNNDIAGTKG
jgi:hypothetical protein